jgi:hypothetical protein
VTKLEEAFSQHGITVTESPDKPEIVVPMDEAYELLGYLELMHGKLYERGLCANGSPIIPGDTPKPLATETGE